MLHTVWVQGVPPLHVLENLTKLSQQYSQQKQQKGTFTPVVWMDQQAIDNLAKCSTKVALAKGIPKGFEDLAAQLGPYADRCKYLEIQMGKDIHVIPVLQYEDFVEDFKRILGPKVFAKLTEIMESQRTNIIAVISDVIRLCSTMLFPGAYVDITDTPLTRLPNYSDIVYPKEGGMVCHTQPGPDKGTILLENDILFVKDGSIPRAILLEIAEANKDKTPEEHAKEIHEIFGIMEKGYKEQVALLKEQLITDPNFRAKFRAIKQAGKLTDFYEAHFGEYNAYRQYANEMLVNNLVFQAYKNALVKIFGKEAVLEAAWEKVMQSGLINAALVTKQIYSWKSPGASIIEKLDYLTSIKADHPLYEAACIEYKAFTGKKLSEDPDFIRKAHLEEKEHIPIDLKQTSLGGGQPLSPAPQAPLLPALPPLYPPRLGLPAPIVQQLSQAKFLYEKYMSIDQQYKNPKYKGDLKHVKHVIKDFQSGGHVKFSQEDAIKVLQAQQAILSVLIKEAHKAMGYITERPLKP